MANQASIAKANIQLGVSADKVGPGLAKVSETLKGWAQKTNTGLMSMLGLAAGPGGWVAAIGGGLSSLLGGFGAGAFSGAISGIKELAAEGRKLKALGVDSGQGMGL